MNRGAMNSGGRRRVSEVGSGLGDGEVEIRAAVPREQSGHTSSASVAGALSVEASAED